MNNNTSSHGFADLYNIIKKLRSPEGCPWDRKQTPDSIKENIIEEAYECVDAIIEKDDAHVCEELGDLFLLATFTGIMYEEASSFSMEDVFNEICAKLVRRHPHVFSNSDANTPEEVIHQWEEIKDKVEGRMHDDSVMDSVPAHFPPLLKALKIQKKAAKENFDWPKINIVISKLDEEIDEFKNAVANNDNENMEEEIGDLLFTIVNISRFLKIDPSTALNKTNTKFISRFKYIEKDLKSKGLKMNETDLDKLEELWQKSKSVSDKN